MQRSAIPVYTLNVRETVPSRALPLSLGMMEAFARTYRDGKLADELEFQPLRSMLTGLKPEQAPPGVLTLDALAGTRPGIWLLTDYLWTFGSNLAISRTVKEGDPRHLVVHGGPHVPKHAEACERFLRAHPYVDIAVRGEGELTCAELLDHLAEAWHGGRDWREGLEAIPGVSFLSSPGGAGELLRGPDRPRLRDLDLLGSPYLDGTFDRWALPNMRLCTVETNRGCPYGCTFCDWGSATQQKVHRFDLQRVKDELSWLGRNQVPIVFIADANFGILDRDVEIAEHLAEVHRRHGFPQEVQVCYAKSGHERLAEIVRILVSAGLNTQGIISIQSMDENTLSAVRRTNIRTEHYHRLAQAFRDQHLPISTDLMIGLPGATVQSHKNDFQFFFDEDIPVKPYPTLLLPNSPMAEPEYVKEHGIRVDDRLRVIATATASEADLVEVKDFADLYELLEKTTLLRYVMRYLQWEHGLPALEFLHRLGREIEARPDGFPHYLRRELRSTSSCLAGVFDAPEAFYNSIWLFCRDVLRLPIEHEAARTVWELNASVVPRRGRRYPVEVESYWDFVDYFRNCRAPRPGETRQLRRADPPLLFEIRDPKGYANMEFSKLWLFTNSLRYFELDWPCNQIVTAATFHEGQI